MPFLSYTQNFDNNLLMLLLRDHKRYMPIVEFFDRMTRQLSELSWAQAELIASEVSKANQSEFCSGIRRGMTTALSADTAALQQGKLQAVLNFALKVNHTPNTIRQNDINAVLGAGWSEQTVEEIVGLVAIQKLYNIIATSLGFRQLDQSAFDAIAEDTLKKGGYTASFEQFVDSPV